MKTSTFRLLIVILALAASSVACKTVENLMFEQPPSSELPSQAENDPTPFPATEPPPTFSDICPSGDCVEACLSELKSVIQSSENNQLDKSSRIAPKFTSNELETLITYSINGNQIEEFERFAASSKYAPYLNNIQSHKELWAYYASIIPASERTSLTEFQIFSDGESELLAAVEQSQDDPEKWVLMVDILDSKNPVDLTYTLIHEYGHLFTLAPDQVPPSEEIFFNPDSDEIYEDEANACKTYFPGEGCSKKNAYINVFVDQFWNDFYDEWVDITYEEDEDTYYDRLDAFYEKYEDQFVTDYSATSPEEDIAEAFSYFILTPKPAGDTIAEEKILFFYQYPELVNLRLEIIQGICSYQK